ELTSGLSQEKIRERFEELDNLFTPNEHANNPIPDDGISHQLSPDQLEKRRVKLMELFAANRVDLTQQDDGVLSVNSVVFISPPYTVNHCTGSNVVVLNRVKNLVRGIDF
ncbi:hypothetical protein FGIG_12361, partial [Fasciola gigantica]